MFSSVQFATIGLNITVVVKETYYIHYVPIKTHHPEGMKLQGRNFYEIAIRNLGIDNKNDRTKKCKYFFESSPEKDRHWLIF
jgi:hypothetical protein